jgi:Transposase DDE domain
LCTMARRRFSEKRRNGREANFGSEPLHEESRTATTSEETILPLGQKWRTGAEGRISVLKRRHGLNRCRYRGEAGMQRWVGLGVIADNLINIGRYLAVTNSG